MSAASDSELVKQNDLEHFAGIAGGTDWKAWRCLMTLSPGVQQLPLRDRYQVVEQPWKCLALVASREIHRISGNLATESLDLRCPHETMKVGNSRSYHRL